MSFWTYMLHCADRSFYVGHTDDLEHRLAQHQHGEVRSYTSSRLPVKLVWSDEFPSRYEALQAERQIKGWGRSKKMALIRGDWAFISQLSRKKESPSTSSGRTEGEKALPARSGEAV
jgi:predicted GIY-YIG superfamily endonuclease